MRRFIINYLAVTVSIQ